MPRPKKKRKVFDPPKMLGFKPFGIAFCDLEHIVMQFDEYETIKLVTYDNLPQQEAADRMEVSRPTLTRIYNSALKKVAQAFVEGKAIFIEGGNYQTDDFWYRCEDCMKLNISKNESRSCTYCQSKSLRGLNKTIKNNGKE